MNIRNIILGVFFLGVSFHFSYSQEILKDTLISLRSQNGDPEVITEFPQILPSSPQASKIIQTVLTPNNHFIGRASVEIPLYEIALKDGTKLPIKLVYNGTGIVPSETKLRVGIGWSLVAEPSIARKVNGLPDEFFYSSERDLESHLNASLNGASSLSAVRSAHGGKGDFQADQYCYKLLNNSGSFFSNNRGQGKGTEFVTVPYDPININSQGNIPKSLIDSKGYKYYMSRRDMIEQTLPGYGYTRPTVLYASLFNADSIISPHNEKIVFKYDNIEEMITNRKSYITSHYSEKFNLNESYEISIENPNGAMPGGLKPVGLEYDLGFHRLEELKIAYSRIVAAEQGYPSMTDPRLRTSSSSSLFDAPGIFIKTKTTIPSSYYPPVMKESIDLVYKRKFYNMSTVLGSPSSWEQASGGGISRIEIIANLQEISFPEGQIHFKEGSYLELDSIIIEDLDKNVIQKIKLVNKIANTESLDPEEVRPILEKVQFLNANNDVQYEYSLEYYAPDGKPEDGLPSRYAKNQDILSSRSYVIKYGADSLKFLNKGELYQDTFHRDKYSGTVWYDMIPNKPKPTLEEIIKNDENLEINAQQRGEQRSEEYRLLKKITYPTGGATCYSYEPHRIYSLIEEVEYPDYQDGVYFYRCEYPTGLRVRKIEQIDPDGKIVNKRYYKYGQNENGEGIPFKKLSAEDFVSIQRKKFLHVRDVSTYEGVVFSASYDYQDVLLANYYKEPIGGMSFENGSYMVYDKVSEYYDNNQKQGGKTIYNFDVEELEKVKPKRFILISGAENYPTNLVSNNSNFWKVGQPLSIEQWKFRENDTFELVSKTEYKYQYKGLKSITSFQLTPLYSIDFTSNGRNDCLLFPAATGGHFEQSMNLKAGLVTRTLSPYGNAGFEQLIRVNDDISGGIKLLKEESVTTDGVKTTKEYEYTSGLIHLNPIKITNLTNDKYTQEYKYIADQPNNDLNDQIMQQNLLDKWNILEQKKNDETISYSKVDFTFLENGSFIPPSKANASSILVPTAAHSGISSTSAERRLTYNKYDSYANPIYLTKDDLTRVVYLWSYEGKYPIAEIKNATYSEVELALRKKPESLSSEKNPDMELINKLRDDTTNLKNALITTYTYKPLVGVLTMTDPRGITTHYEYDSFNRLKESYFVQDGKKKVIEAYDYNYRKK